MTAGDIRLVKDPELRHTIVRELAVIGDAEAEYTRFSEVLISGTEATLRALMELRLQFETNTSRPTPALIKADATLSGSFAMRLIGWARESGQRGSARRVLVDLTHPPKSSEPVCAFIPPYGDG